jgi:hypothetical protein
VLRSEANYFDPSADAVAYAAYREQGFRTESARSRAPIGASSSNGVQQRLKIPGAWWRPDHVDDILARRLLKANGLWDAYWNARRTRWRKNAVARAAAPVIRRAA